MVVGHVMDSTLYTTYSPIIKDVSMILMLLIAVKNWLGLMSGDIGNLLCTSPCVEMFWSCCGVHFVPICGAVVVLKRDLYQLNTASNSFHKYLETFSETYDLDHTEKIKTSGFENMTMMRDIITLQHMCVMS